MSWSEVKKINSDMNKPLDMLIEEKTGDINATGGTASTGGIFAKLNKLLTDWTTARAGKIDSIDTTVSSRASQDSITTLQNTANVINTATTELINGRVVQSVQRGTIQLHSSLPSNNPLVVQINAVNIYKTSIFITSTTGDYLVFIKLLNSTQLELSRSGTTTINVNWQLIEFY